MDQSYELIESEDHLRGWLGVHGGAEVIAWDCEFERQRTYYAKLGLLQMASSSGIAAIDPLTMPSLAEQLQGVISHPHVCLFHSGRQDLEVLQQAGIRLEGTVLDTQIGAGLLGFAEQVSYADLVAQLCGVELDKSQTRTDWLRRPLTSAQVRYACDDVRYLHQVYEVLRARLEALGRLRWWEEDSKAMVQAATVEADSADAWQRVKGLSGLPSASFQRGVRLATWREDEARERDLPRSWILKDAELVALADSAPRELTELAQKLPEKQGMLRRHGERLLALLQETPSQPLIQPPEKPDAAARAEAKSLAARIDRRAESLGLSASLLLTRREIQETVAGRPPARLRSGWRAELLSDEISACDFSSGGKS